MDLPTGVEGGGSAALVLAVLAVLKFFGKNGKAETKDEGARADIQRLQDSDDRQWSALSKIDSTLSRIDERTKIMHENLNRRREDQ